MAAPALGLDTGGTKLAVALAGYRLGAGRGAGTLVYLSVSHADHAILAPSTLTPRIQEMHTLVLHLLSEMLDIWAVEDEGTT